MPDALSPPSDLDDAAYQRALAILVDVGVSLAQELKTPAPDLSITDRANAFERVALPVRRAIILSRHIAESPTAARPKPVCADTQRAMQRKQVIRTVEETIDRKADPAEAGALRRELLERVDTLDFDTDLTHRDPADIIRDLCRDLGVANLPGVYAFPRRTPDDIALLNAQAAALPGTGLHFWSTPEIALPQPSSRAGHGDPERQEPDPPPD